MILKPFDACHIYTFRKAQKAETSFLANVTIAPSVREFTDGLYCVWSNKLRNFHLSAGQLASTNHQIARSLSFMANKLRLILKPELLGVLKSVNLQYNTLVCWADGTNDSSTKRLMFQVLFLVHKILQNSLQKPFQFLFFNYLERQTLGRRVVCPIGPANQRIIL